MPIPISTLIGSTRRLVTAIVLFVLLDLTVLVINLWIAEQVAQDAVAINLAGRQRMLSQQSTKALLQSTLPGHDARDTTAEQEFEEAFGLFSKTLTAFSDGGEARGGDNTLVHLRPVRGEGAQVVSRARELIAPIVQMRADPRHPLDAAERTRAADYMVANNLEILTLMNRLTSALEHDSVRRTRDLRLVQSSAFVLALINFLVIVLGMIRRHRNVELDGQRWREMARHDPLTGIANRKAFTELAGAILLRARGDKLCGAVLMLDLDGFKPINDRFGHPAGDQILTSLAERLEATARATDVVARLGGDDFAILCPLLHGTDDIAQFCERIVATVADIPRDDLAACRLGVSIGIAVYPEDGYELQRLTALADRAMYAAKRAGGNRWYVA
jgi:diguanylate cyclase (GGDEF)-like protein